jgi:hypothetical protein
VIRAGFHCIARVFRCVLVTLVVLLSLTACMKAPYVDARSGNVVIKGPDVNGVTVKLEGEYKGANYASGSSNPLMHLTRSRGQLEVQTVECGSIRFGVSLDHQAICNSCRGFSLKQNPYSKNCPLSDTDTLVAWRDATWRVYD